jgi:RNA polymerase sigma-70 factor (ECF subfamily)
MPQQLAQHFEAARHELHAYLCRLVVRPQVAEDLVQTTFLRCMEADSLPNGVTGQRAWFFRVATNLAFDELRRHGHWRETMVEDLRTAAESNPEILVRSQALVSTPETRAIAREHLLACLACTLRNLPSHQAAALLLKEVHDFSVQETAEVLQASPAQAKNWLQEARAYMRRRYAQTCALITKQGACYQCLELAEFFDADRAPPLPSDADDVEARLNIARALNHQPWGAWHQMILRLVDDYA